MLRWFLREKCDFDYNIFIKHLLHTTEQEVFSLKQINTKKTAEKQEKTKRPRAARGSWGAGSERHPYTS